MVFEDVVKLTEMYSILMDEGTILEPQKVVYNVSIFLADTINATIDDKYLSTISPEAISSFRTIGATDYADTIERYIDKYHQLKQSRSFLSLFTKNKEAMDLNSDFLNKLNTLLETDDLVKNYISKYLKVNKLENDIKHYRKFEEIRAQKQKKQRKAKIDNIIFLTILFGSITFLLIPILIVAIDFGEDGNTFNAINTITNFVTIGISSIITVLCHIFIKRLEKRIIRIILYITLTFVVLIASALIVPDSAFIAYLISAYLLVFINYYERTKVNKLKVKNDKSLSILFFGKDYKPNN